MFKNKVSISTSFPSLNNNNNENSNDSLNLMMNFSHRIKDTVVDSTAKKSEVQKAVTLFWDDYNSVHSTTTIRKKDNNCNLKWKLRADNIEELKFENQVLKGIIEGLNKKLVDFRIKVCELEKSNNRYKREKIDLKNKLIFQMAEVNYLTKIYSTNFGELSVVRKIVNLEKTNREILAKYKKMIFINSAKNIMSKMSSNFKVLVEILPEYNNNDNNNNNNHHHLSKIKKETCTNVSLIKILSSPFLINNIIIVYKLIEIFRICNSLSYNNNNLNFLNNWSTCSKISKKNYIVIPEIFTTKNFSTSTGIDMEKKLKINQLFIVGIKKSLNKFIDSYNQMIREDINSGYYIEMKNEAPLLIGKIDYEVLIKMQQQRNDSESMKISIFDHCTQMLIKLEDRGVNGSKNDYDNDNDDDDDDDDKDSKDKIISCLKNNNSCLSSSTNDRRVRFNPDVKCCLIDEIDVKTSSFMKRIKFIQGVNDYLRNEKRYNNNNNNNNVYIPSQKSLLLYYNTNSIICTYINGGDHRGIRVINN